ncbi:MAG: magnesium and cobalt transport protein CorA [Thermoanaerobaculia bacterium]|nr:magnesium and cobalt transport protein CorA [Thermoanaerobaculia bacterium]MBP9823616.1 magnesium and cobalt transport protein CorA [Thermoanaerobaculia bacterium]
MSRGVIDCASYREGVRVATLALDEIPAALADPSIFVWLGLYEPDEALLDRVQAAFHLHDLAVEDAHRAHQRPKLERYGDSLFIVLRTAQFTAHPAIPGDPSDHRDFELGETHLFVGPRYVVTVRHGSLKDHVGLRGRCEFENDRLALGSGYVLYALLDFVVDQYFPIAEELERQFEAIETDVFDGFSSRETTADLYDFSRKLQSMRRAVSPLLDVLQRLERFEGAPLPESMQVYFRDVHDHLMRIQEMLEGLSEMNRSALAAHLSLLSVAQSDETKRLAAWAAIIAVPTMVAGIYGMNFQFMPELGWRFGYPLVVGSMVLVCLVLYRQFKKSGWL